MEMEQWKQYVLARVTQRKRVKRIVSRLCNGKLFMGFKHWVNVVEYINNGEARIIQRQKLLLMILILKKKILKKKKSKNSIF